MGGISVPYLCVVKRPSVAVWNVLKQHSFFIWNQSVLFFVRVLSPLSCLPDLKPSNPAFWISACNLYPLSLQISESFVQLFLLVLHVLYRACLTISDVFGGRHKAHLLLLLELYPRYIMLSWSGTEGFKLNWC